MTTYRILEKKGQKVPDHDKSCWSGVEPLSDHCSCSMSNFIYLNRFIVQVEKYRQAGIMPPLPYWEDIEEFSSLDEAKAFKRELDLEEGIVHKE